MILPNHSLYYDPSWLMWLISVLTQSLADQPSPPEQLRAQNIDKDSLTLVWLPPEDDDNSITKYIIQKRFADKQMWEKVTEVSGKTKWLMVQNLLQVLSFCSPSLTLNLETNTFLLFYLHWRRFSHFSLWV